MGIGDGRGRPKKDGPVHGNHVTQFREPLFTGDFPEGSQPSHGIPEPAKNWHPIARELYTSALESRATKYYEPVDYMLLFSACEQLSRSLKPRIVGTDPESGSPIYAKVPMSGSELQGILKFFTQLGMSVTDRRRIEVDIRQPNEDRSGESERQAEAVANMEAYRQAMRGKNAG